jgi:hypothetical protein
MQHKDNRPGAGGSARGASGSRLESSDAKHTITSGGCKPAALPRSFAAWCASSAPDSLNLDRDVLARIRRLVARPHMRGVCSWETLVRSVGWLRRPFYAEDPHGWERFKLSLLTLWNTYKGRVS